MYKKSALLVIFVVALICSGYSQKDSVSQKKPYILDTNYVTGYSDKLVIGLFQSWRFYDLIFSQTEITDSLGLSGINYIARGNNSSGISFAYDKIAFSLSSSVEAAESDVIRKGLSKTRNLSFSINSKRYRVEVAYRKYTGFYDNYSARRDSTFDPDSSIYFQNPGMYSKAYRIKGLYFFNKKMRYSYGAAFNNTARQLKSAGSLMFVSNLHKYSLFADSTLLPPGAETFYPGWEKWNYLRVLGMSFNLGYTVNIVLFKRLFANLTGTLGLELQQRNYSTSDGVQNHTDWNFGWSAGDLRGSIGYNGPKFYMMLTYIGDFSVYRLNIGEINTRLNAGMFSFGWRFRMKETKAIKWLKNNKIYKLL